MNRSAFRYLSGLDFAILNVVNEMGQATTAQIVRALPGYDPNEVRNAIRRMRYRDILISDHKGPGREVHWKVCAVGKEVLA